MRGGRSLESQVRLCNWLRTKLNWLSIYSHRFTTPHLQSQCSSSCLKDSGCEQLSWVVSAGWLISYYEAEWGARRFGGTSVLSCSSFEWRGARCGGLDTCYCCSLAASLWVGSEYWLGGDPRGRANSHWRITSPSSPRDDRGTLGCSCEKMTSWASCLPFLLSQLWCRWEKGWWRVRVWVVRGLGIGALGNLGGLVGEIGFDFNIK